MSEINTARDASEYPATSWVYAAPCALVTVEQCDIKTPTATPPSEFEVAGSGVGVLSQVQSLSRYADDKDFGSREAWLSSERRTTMAVGKRIAGRHWLSNKFSSGKVALPHTPIGAEARLSELVGESPLDGNGGRIGGCASGRNGSGSLALVTPSGKPNELLLDSSSSQLCSFSSVTI